MGFKEVLDLDAETTTALGGVNKKTGKKNPSTVEGYFLGSKDTPSKKSKDGIAKLHILQTENGKIGVWGKTDLDRKVKGVTPGTMVRLSHTGFRDTPTGEMYVFRVETDVDNTIDVISLQSAPYARQEENVDLGYGDEDESPIAEETAEIDEAPPSRPVRPTKAASTPDAAAQARVRALLTGGSKR